MTADSNATTSRSGDEMELLVRPLWWRGLLVLLLLADIFSPGLSSAAASSSSVVVLPSVTQWVAIPDTMQELVSQGYVLSHVTETVVNEEGTQDLLTRFYLEKQSDLVRCAEGLRPSIRFGWVLACQRLAQPTQIK